MMMVVHSNPLQSDSKLVTDIFIGYDSWDSFCLIPSTSENTNTITQLKKENSTLKSKIDAMQTQMSTVRKQMALRNEQDLQLRDHIITARKEVSVSGYGHILYQCRYDRHNAPWRPLPASVLLRIQ